ncbi:MAG: LysM peptidoglycan-binding domain-containing protein [bacterium]|nr:LysM peptidoglycan-binding domain-containing protein [bacterium]
MASFRLYIAFLAFLALPGLCLAQGYGVSPDGKKGRIHKVVTGDTLWDITKTYLGTPWIWPSVWKENSDIADPHLITPGDLIWISKGMMRKLSPEEAEEFANRHAEQPAPVPAAPAPPPIVQKAPPAERPDPFAALDASDMGDERFVEVPDMQRYSFVSAEEFTGSGAVMGNHNANYWSSQEQSTIISIGEGAAHVGDSFAMFRIRRRLLHPRTNELLGYFVQVLGRAEVTEIHPEASFVKIVTSYGEVQPGDRVVPFVEDETRIREIRDTGLVEGQIVAYQPYRLRSGGGDLVVLDGGMNQGVKPGRRFEIFRQGKEVRDPLTLTKVLVPDDVIGEAFVLKSSDKTSLALVTRADTDLLIGDHYRTKF